MNIYWNLKSIPEYRDEDKSAIKRTWMPSYKKTYRHWQQWLISIASVSYFIGFLYLPLDASWLLQSLLSGGLFLVLFVWCQISMHLARPYILEELRIINDARQTPEEEAAAAKNPGRKSVIKLVIGVLCLLVAATFLLGAVGAYMNKGVTEDILGQVLAIVISVVIPGGLGFYLVFSKR